MTSVHKVTLFACIVACLSNLAVVHGRPLAPNTARGATDNVESDELDNGVYYITDDTIAGAPGAVDALLRPSTSNEIDSTSHDAMPDKNVGSESNVKQGSSAGSVEGETLAAVAEKSNEVNSNMDRSCLYDNEETGYPSCFFDAFGQRMDCDITDCRLALSSKNARDMLWEYEGQQYRCVTWDPAKMSDDSGVGDVCGCPIDNPLIVATSGFIADNDERMASGKVKFQRCACISGYIMQGGSCVREEEAVALAMDHQQDSTGVAVVSSQPEELKKNVGEGADAGAATTEEEEEDDDLDEVDNQTPDRGNRGGPSSSSVPLNLAERSRSSAYKRKGEQEALEGLAGMLKALCVKVGQNIAADIETRLAHIKPKRDIKSPCIAAEAPAESKKDEQITFVGEETVEDRVAGFDMGHPASPVIEDVTRHTSKVMNIPQEGSEDLLQITGALNKGRTTMTPAGLRFVLALLVKTLPIDRQCAAGATSLSSIVSKGANLLISQRGHEQCQRGEEYEAATTSEALAQLHARLDQRIRSGPGSGAAWSSPASGDASADMATPLVPGCSDVLYDPNSEVDIIHGKQKGDESAGKAEGMIKDLDSKAVGLPTFGLPKVGSKSVESQWAVVDEQIGKTLLKPPQAQL